MNIIIIIIHNHQSSEMYSSRISNLIHISNLPHNKINNNILRNIEIWMLECGKKITHSVLHHNRYIEYASYIYTSEEIQTESNFLITDCICSIIEKIKTVFRCTSDIMNNVISNREIYDIHSKYLSNVLAFLHIVLIFENSHTKDKKFTSSISIRLDDEFDRVFSNEFPEIKKIIDTNKQITFT